MMCLDMEEQMTEYMTIIEAARRAHVSDKTLRRAIHAGKLAARYPQSNRAEVALDDLEAWQASLVMRPGEMQGGDSTRDDLANKDATSSQGSDRSHHSQVSHDQMQDRVALLEAQVIILTVQVQKQAGELVELWRLVEKESSKRMLPKPEDAIPEGFTWLADFARQHFIPYREAERLSAVAAIHGQKITRGRRAPLALGPRGRHDFWVQLHVHPDFRPCDDCPHDEVT
jgi:hypothetical protein